MSKTQKNTAASKTPSSKTDLVEVTEIGKKGRGGKTPVKRQQPKPSTEMVRLNAEDHQVLRRVGAQMLTSAQIDGSVSISCPNDKVADLALRHGAQGLVDEFAPADAVEIDLRAGNRWHSKCRDDQLTFGNQRLG